MPPLISVLIPTCQRFDYCKAALDSVLNNGWEDLEIIVSEDLADGQLERYVQELGEPRVRYTAHPPPAGMIDNWQHATSLALGKYVYKLDDDDLLVSGFLAAAEEFMEKHPEVGSMYTAYELFTQAEQPGTPVVDLDFFRRQNNFVAGGNYLRAVLVNEGGYPCNHKTAVFYRRETAQKIDFYRFAREDFLFGAALALHGDVGYLPKVYFRWRQHESNAAKNLLKTWQSSEAALQSGARLSFSGTETVTTHEWLSLLRRCEHILPAFYVLGALRLGNREQALELYRVLDQRKPEALKNIV